MHTKTATELAELFRSKEVTAEEITATFLERIEQYDVSTCAFLTVFKEQAMEKAAALDKKRREGKTLGKLAGVPIAIKDNIHIRGETTTCASRFLTNYRAPFSATVIRLLEEEDAILLGKTNMDEFAMGSSCENSALKKTVNPWDKTRVPGGSSGGSAAAVASSFCPVALGSDTGGSIRQPASFCGITGFKPTYGRVSRYGLVAFGSSLDQIGPLCKSAEDAALVMEVIGKHCQKDSTTLPSPANAYTESIGGVPKEFVIGIDKSMTVDLEEEVKKAFDDGVERFKEMGANIVEVDLGILRHAIAVYYILATAEASTNLARFDGIRYGRRSENAKTLDEVYDLSKEEGFGPEVKRRILLGTYVLSAGFQDAYYRKAQKVRTLIIEEYKKAFSKCSLIASPTCPSAAFKLNAIKDPMQMYLEDLYTISANLAGIPAISTPNGLTKEGLPLGLQLCGPQKGDGTVLQAASAYEKAFNLHLPTPAL